MRVFEMAGFARVVCTAVALAGCGGGPGSQGVSDGANTNPYVPTVSSPDTDGGAPAATDAGAQPTLCGQQPELGCPCEHAGDTASCHGPVVRSGNYITCAGTRACLPAGVWGPCMPPTYAAPASSR
jgi:hypothetical protein